ncbi:fluoride efflux transporter CrcB [Salinifilum aidingensis]
MLGAPARYALDRAVQQRHDGVFPWGTLAVNVLGSVLLGGIAAAASVVPPAVGPLLGVGAAGALTTYSTFAYEAVRLVEDHAYLYAGLYVVMSVLTTAGAAMVSILAVLALVG